jgi:hypothetical protein
MASFDKAFDEAIQLCLNARIDERIILLVYLRRGYLVYNSKLCVMYTRPLVAPRHMAAAIVYTSAEAADAVWQTAARAHNARLVPGPGPGPGGERWNEDERVWKSPSDKREWERELDGWLAKEDDVVPGLMNQESMPPPAESPDWIDWMGNLVVAGSGDVFARLNGRPAKYAGRCLLRLQLQRDLRKSVVEEMAEEPKLRVLEQEAMDVLGHALAARRAASQFQFRFPYRVGSAEARTEARMRALDAFFKARATSENVVQSVLGWCRDLYTRFTHSVSMEQAPLYHLFATCLRHKLALTLPGALPPGAGASEEAEALAVVMEEWAGRHHDSLPPRWR